MRGRFWCDDQHLGLLLHALAVELEEEPRFHDLPGRGPHAGRLSHSSLAVNAVQGAEEFRSIHSGDALGGKGPSGVDRGAWERSGDQLVVQATIDATDVVTFRLDDPARYGAASELSRLGEVRFSSIFAAADGDSWTAGAALVPTRVTRISNRYGAAACDASANAASEKARQAYPHVAQWPAIRAALLSVCDDAAAADVADWTLGYRPAYADSDVVPEALAGAPVLAFVTR